MSQEKNFELTSATTRGKWSGTTKLLVGAALLVIVGFLFVRFNNIIGPLLLAFVLAYLFRPLANQLVNRLKMKWSAAVGFIYIIFVVLILGFFTVTGVALVQEAQNLVGILTDFLDNLPTMIAELMASEEAIPIPIINEQIVVGEFISGLNIDFKSVAEQTLSVVQPLLGQAGSLVGTIASSAFSFVTWFFFIFLSSFFMLSEAGQFPDALSGLEMPAVTDELERLIREANRLWGAYLRGQILISFIAGIAYIFITASFGVRGVLVLGLMAAIARFVPYVGQATMLVVISVTTFLQPDNYLGLTPLMFAVIVTSLTWLTDQIIDALVVPRVFSSALGVHPAALMVAAIVAANLLGFVGLILAAPVLATAQLILRYVFRKMVDLDPWPHPEEAPTALMPSFLAIPKGWVQKILKLFKRGK